MVWYSPLFQNPAQFIVIHTVKSFGKVNKAEVDIFLQLSCFFDDPADVGNLISGSSAFSKTSLNIRKFTVHVLLKPGSENFEHYFTSMWDECNCAVICTFFGISLVVSKTSWPHGLQPTRLLHPWDFPGKSSGVGCHCFLHRKSKGIKKEIYFCFTDYVKAFDCVDHNKL